MYTHRHGVLREWINPLPSFCLFRLVCVLCVFLFCTPPSHSTLVLVWTPCAAKSHKNMSPELTGLFCGRRKRFENSGIEFREGTWLEFRKFDVTNLSSIKYYHMQLTNHIVMSHVTHQWVTSHCECVMSHEWVMSRINASRRIVMSHVTH